jgi:hypothetical protein
MARYSERSNLPITDSDIVSITPALPTMRPVLPYGRPLLIELLVPDFRTA